MLAASLAKLETDKQTRSASPNLDILCGFSGNRWDTLVVRFTGCFLRRSYEVMKKETSNLIEIEFHFHNARGERVAL